MASSKELTPDHQPIECAVCGRTMLKGERPEAFLVRDGGRRLVCELCLRRAERAGWIRESANPDMPATAPRLERRPSLLSRLKRTPEQVEAAGNGEVAEAETHEGAAGRAGSEPWRERPEDAFDTAAGSGRERRPESDGPRDPRHVRAVPTNQDVKIAHALDLFNQSEHSRTVAGLCRTLGAPWVSALPIIEAPSEVSIVVAWEISWYQYRIDLGDLTGPVMLVAKGDEISELDPALQNWNASATVEGFLAAGVPAG
jgi:hypothetical protein